MKVSYCLLILVLSLCLISCSTNEPSERETDILEGYVPSSSLVSIPTTNLEKVNVKSTFDISSHTNDGTDKVYPYSVFGNGVCIQRDAVNHIWGWADGAANIAISFRDRVYYGSVDAEGNWSVYLPMMTAGGPYEMTIISDVGRITLTDVYVGEVYLLCGQSNMEWKTIWSGNTMADLFADPKACLNEEIRFLNLAANHSRVPVKRFPSGSDWDYARAESIKYFSAIGYLFGKQMQEELGCPVGLVSTAVGGSVIEYWLSDANYKRVKEQYTPITSTDPLFTPSLGYNGLIYPLSGLTFRGCLWYQGCSNTIGTQAKYDIALEILIEQFREEFNNPNMTFTLFELARFNQNLLGYSIINERINVVAKKDPYVIKVLNLDLGEWDNIHPQDKKVIAKRGTDETLKNFYGITNKPCAPEIESYTFNEDGTVTIVLTEEVDLVNGNASFEVFTNIGYVENCNVFVNGNVLTISSDVEFTKVRYGYRVTVTDEMKQDVSKIVSVYDKEGLPLDLFIIEK